MGSTIRKTGIVLRFFPANSLPLHLDPWLKDLKPSQLKFNPSERSRNDRYLVRVTTNSKQSNREIYYAPRASVVIEQN